MAFGFLFGFIVCLLACDLRVPTHAPRFLAARLEVLEAWWTLNVRRSREAAEAEAMFKVPVAAPEATASAVIAFLGACYTYASRTRALGRLP